MDTKIQIAPPNNLSVQAPTSLTQNGDNNTQVAHANTVQNVTNFIMQYDDSLDASIALPQWTLNHSFYNLFVIAEEDFTGRYFFVPKDRALTQSTTDKIKSEYATLNREAISKIKTFPAIFANKNHNWGYTSGEHKAYFGAIRNIKIQGNGIKIYHQRLASIPQQKLNELASDLDVQKAAFCNEFNCTHWAIKQINLIRELENAGITIDLIKSLKDLGIDIYHLPN